MEIESNHFIRGVDVVCSRVCGFYGHISIHTNLSLGLGLSIVCESTAYYNHNNTYQISGKRDKTEVPVCNKKSSLSL